MVALISAGVHRIGVTVARVFLELFRSNSAFAEEGHRVVRDSAEAFTLIAFVVVTVASVAYIGPIYRFASSPGGMPASERTRRRALNLPLVYAALGAIPWMARSMLNPLIVYAKLGTWNTELLSSQVFTPVFSGFLSSISAYLLIEWIARSRIIPAVFPDGRIHHVPGAWTLSVPARLFVLLVALGFVPTFTMLGLFQAAEARVAGGMAGEKALDLLIAAGQSVSLVFFPIGVLFTWLLATSLAQPLRRISAALERVTAGDLNVRIPVRSADEVGVLGEGVNDMVATLVEREHILTTFGRIVEPEVRDRLLAGSISAEGETRKVAVLFSDLRGFTHYAETADPREVTRTLNQFFTIMTAWVRESGGYVDKFIGDALLVVYGLFDENEAEATQNSPARSAALPRREPARTSSLQGKHCAAALRGAAGMQERLEDWNQSRAERGLEPLGMRIGIHSGEVIAGAIGAADRHEYTVMGDTVNVAARLQELCKTRDVELLVSKRTIDQADTGAENLSVLWTEDLEIRGRSESVSTCAVRFRDS